MMDSGLPLKSQGAVWGLADAHGAGIQITRIITQPSGHQQAVLKLNSSAPSIQLMRISRPESSFAVAPDKRTRQGQAVQDQGLIPRRCPPHGSSVLDGSTRSVTGAAVVAGHQNDCAPPWQHRPQWCQR